MADTQITKIAHTTGFEVGELSVKCLGLLLITKKLSHNDCIPMVNKIIGRIGSWRGNFSHM